MVENEKHQPLIDEKDLTQINLELQPLGQNILENEERPIDRNVSQHKYSFNGKICFWSLIYNLVYYYAFGWIFFSLYQLSAKCCHFSLGKLFHNLNMKSYYWFEKITVGVAINASVGTVWFLIQGWKSSLFRGIVCLWINTLFVVVSQVIMVAYTNEDGARLITNEFLDEKEMNYLRKMEIFNEKNELRNTFKCARTHVSLLYFNYMPENNEQNAEMKRGSSVDIDQDDVRTAAQLRTAEQLITAMEAGRVKFEKMYFAERTPFDVNKLCGYKLAQKLLKITEEAKFIPKKNEFFWATILIACGFWVYELDQILKMNQIKYIFYHISFLFIIIYILEIIHLAFWNLERRNRIMEELGNLITPGEPWNLNTFDFLSLKTWMDLRRVFMRYGEAQMKVLSWIMVSILVTHTIVAIGLLVLPLSRKNFLKDDLMTWLEIFNGQFIVPLVLFVAVISRALAINHQFDRHKELLQQNQKHIETMFGFHSDFNPPRPRIPRNLFGPFESLPQDEMEKEIDKLKKMYDDILKDLEFEEKNNPIKLIRITVNYKLVMVYAVPLLTSLWDAFLKKYWFV